MIRVIVLLTAITSVTPRRATATVSPAAWCDATRCTCVGRPTVADARKGARDVALVEPIARRDTLQRDASDGRRSWTSPAYVVTLRVHARWQGAPSDTLEVLTMRNEGMCGVAFALGERYVLFTEGTSGMATVNLCSLTALVSRSAQTLRALGAPLPAR